MQSRATVANQFVHAVLAVSTLLGAQGDRIAAAAGIPAAALADRDGRLPVHLLIAAFDEIERATGDVTFGLHCAEIMRRSTGNVLALAITSSATFGEALLRLARYMRIIHDGAALDLIVAGAALRVRYRVAHADGPHRVAAQLTLAQLCLLGRERVGAQFRADGVFFRHVASPATGEYERLLQAPIAFEQPHDELLLRASLLAEPLRQADPALCRHLDRYLDRMLASAPGDPDLLARVRRAIGEDLRDGLPDIAAVARRLRTSARSLQRQLLAAGTTFQKQLDSVRHELALGYLEEGLALAEIAFLLGYTDPSNFHRAFKRWTGMTPAEARQRAGCGADVA
ncbi:MAG TPA: AraC family transcriptional regulator ligand-binding domain-containing protein [Kofleriaceae bacterium]|nr:AraC family transcriptional regulator ligand-binding domain-containing protein [Kofleriaceae bacterium]